MSREAMKLALSTLESWACYPEWIYTESALQTCKRNTLDTITALRAALDAPESEPVWIQRTHLESARREPSMCRVEPTQRRPDFVPLYTAPREWVGLTDEDLKAVFEQNWGSDSERPSVPFAYERAIEAKIKEKNRDWPQSNEASA